MGAEAGKLFALLRRFREPRLLVEEEREAIVVVRRWVKIMCRWTEYGEGGGFQ